MIGLYIRLRLEDTPEFRALVNAGEVPRSPLKEALARNWREILLVGGLVVVQFVGYYVVLVYMQTYIAEELGFSSVSASLSAVLTLLVVDGDPLDDISVLQKKENLKMILKGARSRTRWMPANRQSQGHRSG